MSKSAYDCSIDGQDYSLELLAAVRYHRDLHVLHEMGRAGANVVHNGKTLSDDDIQARGRTPSPRSARLTAFNL